MLLPLIAAVIIFVVCLCFVAFDERLKVTEYRISDARIENEICIVMLSDLHRSLYGEEQEELIALVDAQQPDAVLLGGDIFDEHGGYENAAAVLKDLSAKYPCFYVSGNHEFGIETTREQVADFKDILKECGILWLSGTHEALTVGNTTVELYGIDDENRYTIYRSETAFAGKNFLTELQNLSEGVDENRFSILLCHRPLGADLKSLNFDLQLSGHTHGGQWRFPPFFNGVYAPGQGYFPKYAYGRYKFERNTLIVGAGLCNTYGVVRIFNRPEIVVVRLTNG